MPYGIYTYISMATVVAAYLDQDILILGAVLQKAQEIEIANYATG